MVFVSVFAFSEFDIALRYQSRDASVVRGTDTDIKVAAGHWNLGKYWS